MAEQAEFYIGDKVRIKDNCQSTDFLLFVDSMEQYEGREAYISGHSRYYTLDIDNGCYDYDYDDPNGAFYDGRRFR